MTNNKELTTMKEKKEELKRKTNDLVSKDKELFDNLTKPEITEIKTKRAKKFRSENSWLLRDTVIERCKELFKDPNFKWTKEMANDIIRVGHVMYFWSVHDRFQWLDKETAMNLLKHNNSAVLWYISAFDNLDEEIALESLGHYTDPRQEFDMIVNNINKFKWLKLDKSFALKLIEAGKARCFSANIDRFDSTGFDKDFALKLLKAKNLHTFNHYGNISNIMTNINKFEWLKANTDFANEVIEAGECSYIVENPEKFEWFSLNKDVALKLIERKEFYLLLRNLRKFKWLDKDIAFKIIASCDDFSLNQGDYQKQNLWELIVENHDVFDGLKVDEELAICMLDHQRNIVFNRTIGKFQKLDKTSALKCIKNSGRSWFMEKKANYFNGMDRDVAVALMDSNIYEAQNILDRLSIFGDTTPNKIAHYLKNKNQTYSLTSKLSKCVWLDTEIKKWLIESWHQKDVDEYPMAFAA